MSKFPVEEGGIPPELVAAKEQADPTPQDGVVLSWLTWLEGMPSRGINSTEAEVLDFLRWSVGRLHIVNEHPVHQQKITSAERTSLESARLAATAKRISPALLQALEASAAEVKVGYIDVFDVEQRQGYYMPSTNGIYVPTGFKPTTYTHELLHASGSVVTNPLEEAIATELQIVISESNPRPGANPTRDNASIYRDERHVLRKITTAAELTTYELSDIYADRSDAKSNLLRLRETVARRVGYDMVGSAVAAFDTTYRQRRGNNRTASPDKRRLAYNYAIQAMRDFVDAP